MAELEETSAPSPIIPLLPPEILVEIIELIVSHSTEPYAIKMAYSWWNYKRRFRIYNIPHFKNLELVSHLFNNTVKHRIRRIFNGQLIIEYDAALKMQYFRRCRSVRLRWLFDHTTMLVVRDYKIDDHRQPRLDLKYWPALRWLRLQLCDSHNGAAEALLGIARHTFNSLNLRNAPAVLRKSFGIPCFPAIKWIERTEEGALIFRGEIC